MVFSLDLIIFLIFRLLNTFGIVHVYTDECESRKVVRTLSISLTLHVAFLSQSELSEFCFVPFAAVCLLSALYIGMFLPETKGKTLAAITSEFHKLNFKGQDQQCESQTQAQYQLGEVCLSTAL